MNVKRILVATVMFIAGALYSFAQERHHVPARRPEGMPERSVMLTAEERAVQRTDEMDKAISLDEKQYKKIYKIFLKEENAKNSAMESGSPVGPPPGAVGGGRPPQGGGYPGGRPGMGGAFQGNPGAGGPPSGMPFPNGFGVPQKPTVGGKEIDSDEYIDEREEKFKKILSSGQYMQWRKLHPDPTGFFVK